MPLMFNHNTALRFYSSDLPARSINYAGRTPEIFLSPRLVCVLYKPFCMYELLDSTTAFTYTFWLGVRVRNWLSSNGRVLSGGGGGQWEAAPPPQNSPASSSSSPPKKKGLPVIIHDHTRVEIYAFFKLNCS